MDYRKTAEAIYEKVGKRENLVSVAHCSTRLRLVLADDKKCDAKAVENIDGVDHFIVSRDVTADSHPAYTGEKRFVDTAGRVEKFQKKFSRRRA